MQFLTKDKSEHLNALITGLPEYEITYSVVNDNEVGGYLGIAKELCFLR